MQLILDSAKTEYAKIKQGVAIQDPAAAAADGIRVANELKKHFKKLEAISEQHKVPYVIDALAEVKDYHRQIVKYTENLTALN